MKGKEKCKALKEIRQKIAEQNDIAFAVSECTHQGDCKGTCPKCEAELRYLERELAIRQNLGKAVVVAGISVGICAPLTACNPIETIGNVIEDVYYSIIPPEEDIAGKEEPAPEDINTSEPYSEEAIEGDVEYYPSSEEDSEDMLAGEIYIDPSYEINSDQSESSDEGCGTDNSSTEDLEDIDAYTLEGDIVVDPEFLDEE